MKPIKPEGKLLIYREAVRALDADTRGVYLELQVLIEDYGDGEEVYFTVGDVAFAARLSVKRTLRALRVLERCGLVKIEQVSEGPDPVYAFRVEYIPKWLPKRREEVLHA